MPPGRVLSVRCVLQGCEYQTLRRHFARAGEMTRMGGLSAQGTMVSRLALAILALSVTLPMCTSSILPASLGARLESENSLLQLAWSAVSSGLPRLTHSRILLADAAVTPCSLIVSHCGSGVHAR
jgi:hypothetical protein